MLLVHAGFEQVLLLVSIQSVILPPRDLSVLDACLRAYQPDLKELEIKKLHLRLCMQHSPRDGVNIAKTHGLIQSTEHLDACDDLSISTDSVDAAHDLQVAVKYAHYTMMTNMNVIVVERQIDECPLALMAWMRLMTCKQRWEVMLL